MLTQIKIMVLIVLMFRLYQYWRGSFFGVVLRRFMLDITYLGIGLLVFFRIEPFGDESLYLDIALLVVLILYMIEILYVLRLYVASRNFDIKSEKRMIYFVEHYLQKNKMEKCYRLLISHPEVVRFSAHLLIHLGNFHLKNGKFQEAYDCFVEATEFTKEEELLLLACDKAFQTCTKELNDQITAKQFIQTQLVKDLSPHYVQSLEKILKEPK